ncbi:MAG: Asp-tRNA(Asn)/Glu-tRNA(Gln) amidotransferase subunit GatC [Candidatus Levyibacteriota bacterium]
MKIDGKKIAKLANLPIEEHELQKLEKQLEQTIKHVDRLQAIDTSKTSGTNEVTSRKNVMREDTIRLSLSQEEALKNAKETYNGFFVVPVIIEGAIA